MFTDHIELTSLLFHKCMLYPTLRFRIFEEITDRVFSFSYTDVKNRFTFIVKTSKRRKHYKNTKLVFDNEVLKEFRNLMFISKIYGTLTRSTCQRIVKYPRRLTCDCE